MLVLDMLYRMFPLYSFSQFVILVFKHIVSENIKHKRSYAVIFKFLVFHICNL